MKTIRITCKTGFIADIGDLLVLQNDLKDLTKENYEKLKKEILTEGFDAPFFIWQDHETKWILDGTQRYRVLSKLRNEGYEIPPLPIVPIEAKDILEAKRKLLGFASQYGNMTSQGLYEFISTANIPFEEMDSRFRFPEIKNDEFKAEYFEETKSSEGEIKEKEIDENINTNHECPSCGYVWG